MSTKQRVSIVFLLALFPILWIASGYIVELFSGTSSPSGPTHRWYKGNTHTHTLWSDGNDFPESVIHFYKENGYQFLVLTDHNILSRGEKWMAVSEVDKRRQTLGHPTLEKYRALFGEEWVETRMATPEMEAKVDGGAEVEAETEVEAKPPVEQVRLKALSEIRGRFEQEEQFLLIEGEEITDRYKSPSQNHEVHMNAVNLGETIEAQGGESVRDVIANNLRAIREQEERLKRPILEHLNHPNFQWSIVPDDIASVIDLRYFEVYNGHPFINHRGRPAGDGVEAVPGDEEIWDIVNTIRIRDLKVEPLLGVATDDAHHYHGGDSSPGRGWVMVHATKLAAPELIGAMRDGDFYASTGVSLALVHDDSESLRVDIDPEEGVSYVTEFFGTRNGNGSGNAGGSGSGNGEGSDPSATGELLASYEGPVVLYQFRGDELFVRARVTSSLDHPNPSYEGQKQQAWTQPVGWKTHLPAAQVEDAGAVESESARQ